MAALRIEDGRRWWDVAVASRVEDAQAIFSADGPDWHFLTRPRGGSKSTDIAAVAIGWLIKDARPLANGHIVAASTDQAAIIIDAIAGFVARTPELHGAVNVESKRVIAKNGAWIEVLAQSDSGAWGLRDAHLLICDEFCQWPETRGARRVWTAIYTTAPKVEHCKLIILSSAGDPSRWSWPIYQEAQESVLWRVSAMPGPVPWLNAEKLAQLERSLSPSAYDRLVLNIWSESEDRAISPEDYERAQQESFRHGVAPPGVKGGGSRLHWPRPDTKYILLADIGTRKDATVMTVAHKEPLFPDERQSPFRVVIDHIDRWQGSKKHHVQIDSVTDRVQELSREYNRAKVYA